ncbi:MAG: hypothetical protein IPN53_22935 [Comamonadaceae bacterium]|nr:hypothetical protein [Comamonadaceae bacterium]
MTWVSCNDAAGDGTTRFGSIPHGGNVSALDPANLSTLAAWSTAATGVRVGAEAGGLAGYWPNQYERGHGTNPACAPAHRHTDGAGCSLALVARATTGCHGA